MSYLRWVFRWLITIALCLVSVAAIAAKYETMDELRGAVLEKLVRLPNVVEANPDPNDPSSIICKVLPAGAKPENAVTLNIFLGNLAGRLLDAAPGAADMEIDRFIANMVETTEPDAPLDPERVFIALRPRDYLAVSQGPKNEKPAILFQELPGNVIEVYLQDYPDRVELITEHAAGGRSLADIRALGLKNMRREMERLTQEEFVPGVTLFSIDGNPALASGMLLTDEFWNRLWPKFPAGYLVIAPRRDQVFVFSKDMDDAALMARKLIEISFKDGADLLSDQFFDRRDGKLVAIQP